MIRSSSRFIAALVAVLAVPGWAAAQAVGACYAPYGYNQIAGVGASGDGAGAAIYDLNDNGKPDVVFMAYDDPTGGNTFRYRVVTDVDEVGCPTAASVITEQIEVGGVGSVGDGAGIRFLQLDEDPLPDMILMAYDDPSRSNTFRYRIGYNVDPVTFRARSWMPGWKEVRGVGYSGQGAGLAVWDLNGNGRPDVVFVAYDAPTGANSWRYVIGWDMAADGSFASVGPADREWYYLPGVGCVGDGAGIELAQLDDDPEGRPDMVLMAYDDPDKGNTFRFRVGYNVDATGQTEDWWPESGYYVVPGFGYAGQGADVVLYDLDNDGFLEWLFMAYDAPTGANSFRYVVYQ